MLRVAVSLLVAFVLSLTSAIARADVSDDKPDRSTPRRAVAAFLEAAEANAWARAAESLDLGTVPADRRAVEGPELAKELHAVLDRAAWIELDRLSDDPRGHADDGASTEVLTVTSVAGHDTPITMTRTSGAEPEWLFSAATVARIPKLFEEHGPGPIERRMPESVRGLRVWGLEAWQWIGLPVAFVLAILFGMIATRILLATGGRVVKRTTVRWDDELLSKMRGPTRIFVAALAFRVLLDLIAPNAAVMVIMSKLVGMATIAATAWVAIRVVVVLAETVERRAKRAAEGAADEELRARGITTQVRVLRRVINVTISIVAVALMLTEFEVVRNVGVSLLASAGIAGIVLGLAAQRTIGTLIAGIQMSATQPIRIGDVIVIEKEFGTVEEVTLTYVVVKIWDERRLIVPMTRFLEQPFENWTRGSSQVHGAVFFKVDWSLPVDELRAEVDRIVEKHPCWDGRTKNVQVTDARDGIEVRVLVSAADSSKLWDLRVDVREKIVHWLQTFHDGKHRPVVRVTA